MAGFDRENPTAPMPGYGRDAASPEREKPLTREEMESLFDDVLQEVDPVPPPAPDAVARAFHGKGPRVGMHDPQYQSEAEQYFQAGHIIGKGDTYAVRDELKRLGCKWHALRERWVAPNAALLASAMEVVKRGPSVPPMPPPKVPKKKKFATARAAQSRESFLQVQYCDSDPPERKQLPAPPPTRAELLFELERRGVVDLPTGSRLEAALGDAPDTLTDDELAIAFAKADKAFEL